MERVGSLALAVGLWMAGLRSRWTSLTPPARTSIDARARGAAGSVALHVLMAAGLLWTGAGPPLGLVPVSAGGGQPDARDGEALSVTLVSLAPSSAARAGGAAEVRAGDAHVDAAPDRRVSHDGDLAPELQGEPQTGQLDASGRGDQASGPAASPSPASAANGAQAFDADLQAGQPDGSQSLLRQIARCLPSGARPSLPFARLIIVLDKDGALSAAPRLATAMPYGSSDAIKDADRVVQAALQCGPYHTSSVAPQSLALVPDFSFLASLPELQRP